MAQGQDDRRPRRRSRMRSPNSRRLSSRSADWPIFLDRQNQRQECELTIKDAFARIQEPQPRRDLGLLLAEFYYRWQEKEKLCQWLTDLTAQFPSDIQPRRLLLTCDPVVQDAARSQKIIDEIKALEGEKGSQWRYEQARLWIRPGERLQAQLLRRSSSSCRRIC